MGNDPDKYQGFQINKNGNRTINIGVRKNTQGCVKFDTGCVDFRGVRNCVK